MDITIKNNTDEDIDSPAISFDVSKIQNITPGSEIRAYTGFDQQTFIPPIIKGNLSDLLKAKSSVTITFGVNFNSTSGELSLPTDFTFNGKPIVIPEDHTPPTNVENIVTASSGPTGFSLNWTPSRDDDTGVEKYVVNYTSSDGKVEHEATTSTNNISLKGLTANTNYQVNIIAVDYAGNMSASTSYCASTDEALKGPARWQDGNQIKGSPFVDGTGWPTPPIDKWAELINLKGYFLGFITAAVDKDSGEVKACWGGNLSMFDLLMN